MKSIFPSILLFVVSNASAAVPNRITYQGRLTKSGVTMAGLRSFKACIVGGAVPWCDPGQTLNLPPSGDFTLVIEPPASTDWTSSALRLELTVDGHVLSPADAFTSVPYALLASSASFAAVSGTAQTAQALTAPLPASQVKLTGGTTLDSWQSPASPALINAAKIAGTVPPGPHAASHMAGQADALADLSPSQISGTALVSNAASPQTLRPTADVIPLAIKGLTNGPASTPMFEVWSGQPGPLPLFQVKGNGTAYLNGPVGVGTTNPGAKLAVQTTGTDTAFSSISGAAAGWGADIHNNDAGGDRSAKLAGGTYAGIFMNGNVGVGTTAPAQALSVNGQVEATAVRIGEDPSNRASLRYVKGSKPGCPAGSVTLLKNWASKKCASGVGNCTTSNEWSSNPAPPACTYCSIFAPRGGGCAATAVCTADTWTESVCIGN